MAQTAYAINIPAVAYPGQPADTGIKDDTTALAVAAAIPYGRLVVRDTANSPDAQHIGGKLPAASGDITAVGSALGVSVADQARAQDPTVSTPQYPQYSAVPCRRIGRIWVLVEEAVNAGDQAFVRYADGTVTGNNGGFRKSADTSTAAALPGAYYVTPAGANGYAQVELSLA